MIVVGLGTCVVASFAKLGIGCNPLVVLDGIEPCNERLSLGRAMFDRWRCFYYERR